MTMDILVNREQRRQFRIGERLRRLLREERRGRDEKERSRQAEFHSAFIPHDHKRCTCARCRNARWSFSSCALNSVAMSNPNPIKTAISPQRDEDFPEWYQQVIRAAELAESSDVRGCMVIRPWGYGIWENMQRQLDAMFRATGHRNAYFPLLIPLSYFAKEAEHVQGFAKECAVVTHSRLEADADGKLRPSSALTEPLVIRPTSETIIGASYAQWVQSYRDLPILINPWANVVRWEMRPRLFLRTTEFLWQEGHTAHETAEEAIAETLLILDDVYRATLHEDLAMPVRVGRKSASQRFPGAVETYCLEGGQVSAGRPRALPRADLRQGLRRPLPGPRRQPGSRLRHVGGRLPPAGRRCHHAPRRRRGAPAPASPRPGPGGRRADLPQRR